MSQYLYLFYLFGLEWLRGNLKRLFFSGFSECKVDQFKGLYTYIYMNQLLLQNKMC